MEIGRRKQISTDSIRYFPRKCGRGNNSKECFKGVFRLIFLGMASAYLRLPFLVHLAAYVIKG